MKNKEKQTRETAKNPKQQARIKAAGKNLSDTELDKVAGAGSTYVSSKSNVKTS